MTAALSLLDLAAVAARLDDRIPADAHVSANLWADRVEVGIHSDRAHAVHLAHTFNLVRQRTSPGLTTTWVGAVAVNDKQVPLHVVHYVIPTERKAAA